MKLLKVTVEKITERGWITPEEIKNAFDQLVRDFDTKLTRGNELRRDLIMTRIDNFKMELISICEKNIDREEKRVQSDQFGGVFREELREQESGGSPDSPVQHEREMRKEGTTGVGDGPGLGENSGADAGSSNWQSGGRLGKTRSFSNKG